MTVCNIRRTLPVSGVEDNNSVAGAGGRSALAFFLRLVEVQISW
ncbi:hypothetical protein SAMN05443144_1129 [Fodinibius roseus]|uniref:Uncharacterized protein n=1 Tax=Fodinibius roseus TaxID=1194090 RepID=A0A1M5DRM6_9BACT|nr:hypothetical protein [Fodinibius roseus]SHF69511.1 hypothetical protein SAMN05443144_1129 [Fodinibius roseus]